MSLADAPTPFLSADFGEEGGKYSWNTWEDVNNWIGNLQTQWAWLNSTHLPNGSAWTILTNTVNNVSSNLQQAQAYINQNQPEIAGGNLQAAKNQLQSFITTNPWLLAKNPRRTLLEEMRDSGKPLEAATIAAYWLQQNINGIPSHIAIPALIHLEFYERGIKDRFKTENTALKRLAGELQTELNNVQQSHSAQIDRFEKLHELQLIQFDTNQMQFDDSQQSRGNQWQQKQAEVQTELDTIKDTYDRHMALAAPVEYWENKRIKHNRWAIGSFVILIVSMIVLGLVLNSKLHSLEKVAIEKTKAIQSAKQAISTPAASTPPSPIINGNNKAEGNANEPIATADQAVSQPFAQVFEPITSWALVSLILLATLSFWFIRIVVRIFLSSLHLENDAAERVTMVKTYLAMIRDGGLPKGENISTVLAALFRPTGDGIVKDEGLPPSAMEWLTKLGGSK